MWRNESECYKCCQSWVWFIAKNYPTHTLSLSAFFHYITGHSQSPEQFPYSLYLVQKQFIRIDEKYLPHSITRTLGQVSLSDGHYIKVSKSSWQQKNNWNACWLELVVVKSKPWDKAPLVAHVCSPLHTMSARVPPFPPEQLAVTTTLLLPSRIQKIISFPTPDEPVHTNYFLK